MIIIINNKTAKQYMTIGSGIRIIIIITLIIIIIIIMTNS